MGEVLYGLWFSILYVVLCILFVSCFTKKREISNIVTYICYIAWTLFIIFISFVKAEQVYIRILCIPLCTIIFLWILQELSVIQAVFVSLIYYGIGCATEYFVIILYNSFIENYDAFMAGDTIISMMLGIISHIMILILILLISYFRGNFFFELLDKKDWFSLVVFPVFSIVVIFSLVINFSNNENNRQQYTLILISIGLLVLNFFVLFIMREIMIRNARIRETQIMYERASNTAQKYFDKAESYEEQKKREHEFKNHLTVIHNLICNSEYERAKLYTEEISEQNVSYTDIIDMNHPIINSVVNTKYREALEKGIFMSFEVCNIADVPISDNDITIIVSNLLSNAIEACEKDNGDNSFIKFKVHKEDNLYIAVINSFSNKPVLKNGVYITTKEDKQMHGFGIRNIVDAVKRNNGEYVIDAGDNEFSFVICIPL